MTHFDRFTAKAAVLDEPNVDTDAIFPARFLLLLDREGLGIHAFEDRRLLPDGTENPAFVLNQSEFRDAGILIAGANFGCGSSREHAVWTLHDRGIHCVIAPSFGEIFYANCFRNGVLPVTLPEETLAKVRDRAAAGEMVTVDLEKQHIELVGLCELRFEVAPDRREALLRGLDDAGLILQKDMSAIEAYEQRRGNSHPWLFL